VSSIQTRYKNKKFVRERIQLDGNAYENCEFQECLIVLEKGETEIKSCRVHKCQFLLLEPALQIARVLQTFLGDKPLRVLDFSEPEIYGKEKGPNSREFPDESKAEDPDDR